MLPRIRNVRGMAFAGLVAVVVVGCTQQLVWPKEPLHVVIDDAPDGGGVPIKLVSAKSVLGVDDVHRIDPGCTRAFPFRSFAKGPLSEKQGLFSFAARQGFVYQLELIAADAGPRPQVQFYDGDSPIPVPAAGTWFGNGLSVKTTGSGSVYLRASTCGF